MIARGNAGHQELLLARRPDTVPNAHDDLRHALGHLAGDLVAWSSNALTSCTGPM